MATATVDPTALVRQVSGALSTEAILSRVTRIQEIKSKVMKKGVHFGEPYPGANKDTLLKPGAELLLMTFQIGAKPDVEDLSTPDAARYRVRQIAMSQITGEILGEYVAEASSAEEKRQWRAAVCDEEWEDTPADQRRKHWKKGGDFVLQIRTNPPDEAGDVLAMAQKRALVGLTRLVLACSDLFDQNLEDMPDYLKERVREDKQPSRTSAGSGGSPAKEEKPTKGTTEPVQITGYKPREIKKRAGGMTTKYEITAQGIIYSTFLERLAKSAEAVFLAKGYARLTWKLNEPYGRDLEKLEEAAAPTPATTPATTPAAATTTREREPGDDDENLAPAADQLKFG